MSSPEDDMIRDRSVNLIQPSTREYIAEPAEPVRVPLIERLNQV